MQVVDRTVLRLQGTQNRMNHYTYKLLNTHQGRRSDYIDDDDGLTFLRAVIRSAAFPKAKPGGRRRAVLNTITLS